MTLPVKALAFLLLAWPLPAGSGEKLHGKITAFDGKTMQIAFTVQPRETILKLSGDAPVAVGDFVDFDVTKGNKVELDGKQLQIEAVQWVP